MKKVATFLVSIAIMTSWVFAARWELPSDHLEDVTNGSVRGISTTDESGGFAKTWYNEDGFGLHAWFHDIADPLADDFYEGWLVQQNPFKFISTWELELKEDGYYHNVFSSDIDYTSYDFYVLTLEPNDGNPDPAAHIFEWNVVMADMMKDDKMIKDYAVESDVIVDVTWKNFEFSQDTIEVNKGDRVTINFESTSGFHDWWIDEFDAWTKQVNPGEKTSVTFIADKVGNFEFYCSVGNHRAAGMTGWLIVKDTNMMKKDKMIKKLTVKQEVLKKWIKKRLAKIDSSKLNQELISVKIQMIRDTIDERGFSNVKKERYLELLDVIEVAIWEVTAMSQK